MIKDYKSVPVPFQPFRSLTPSLWAEVFTEKLIAEEKSPLWPWKVWKSERLPARSLTRPHPTLVRCLECNWNGYESQLEGFVEGSTDDDYCPACRSERIEWA